MVGLPLLSAVRQALRLRRRSGLGCLKEVVVWVAAEAAGVAESAAGAGAVSKDVELGVVERRLEAERGRGRVEHGRVAAAVVGSVELLVVRLARALGGDLRRARSSTRGSSGRPARCITQEMGDLLNECFSSNKSRLPTWKTSLAIAQLWYRNWSSL